MKKNTMATLSPLCLALFAGHACAALEPFSFGASETLQHQSNINHTDSDTTPNVSDWMSTTELNAALDQALGRDKLVATAAIDFNRYRHEKSLNAIGYQVAAELDWSTVGDLSGSFGGDSHRRQYIAGETAETTPGTAPVVVTEKNLQTDNHAFARIMLGGESRWAIFGGGDFNQRKYSLDSFDSNDEHQWSTNVGTRYQTSPDLSFGLTGNFVHGEYPDGGVIVGNTIVAGASKFSTRTISATTRWQASGSSALDGNIGYTTEDNAALTSDRKFLSGGLNWNWTPPSHFTVSFGLRRSSDADASAGLASATSANNGNLNGTSINNAAHLEVTYALTAKVTLDASTDYTQRKYSGLRELDTTADGSTRTARFYLTAHYAPTRTTDVSCGGGRETRHADARIIELVNSYTNNSVQCAASIRFD